LDMICCVMEQHVPICATLVELKSMDLLAKEDEVRLFEEAMVVLKPFKGVTVQVSA